MNPKKKQCGKTVYKTREDAVEGARTTNYLRRKFKEGGRKITHYQCDKCGNFHLTSKDTSEFQVKRMSDEELEIAKKKREKEKELTLLDLINYKDLDKEIE